MQETVTAHAAQLAPQSLSYQKNQADFIWKISNFKAKLTRAVNDKKHGGYESEPFFFHHGYKMKLKVYLNEAPSGHPGYMGVYMRLMKSDRDVILPWPFNKRFTLVLLDQQDDLSQRKNIERTATPAKKKTFERPEGLENKGEGWQKFVSHSVLQTRHYISDDTVYIMIVIDS